MTSGASQIIWEAPPATAIFFSLPSSPNAMKRLSGDQMGVSSAAVRGRAMSESSRRTQSCFRPVVSNPMNASH